MSQFFNLVFFSSVWQSSRWVKRSKTNSRRSWQEVWRGKIQFL